MKQRKFLNSYRFIIIIIPFQLHSFIKKQYSNSKIQIYYKKNSIKKKDNK